MPSPYSMKNAQIRQRRILTFLQLTGNDVAVSFLLASQGFAALEAPNQLDTDSLNLTPEKDH